MKKKLLFGFFCFFWVFSFSTFGQTDPDYSDIENDISTRDKNSPNFLSDSNPFAGGDTIQQQKGRYILDDTSKVIFGPHTTLFTTKDELFEMVPAYMHRVDTLVDNFHRYSYQAKADYKIQNTANLGSPSKPLFFTAPDIGKRIGFNALDPFMMSVDALKYYNSKSPYSEWSYAEGGQGRALLDVFVSQNIKPNWSVAFNYKSLFTNELLGNEQLSTSLRQSRSVQFMFSTWYQTKDERYKLLASYVNVKYPHGENGGLILADTILVPARDTIIDPTMDDYLQLQGTGLYQNYLSAQRVSSVTNKRDFNLYHEFAVKKGDSSFIAFHELNRNHFEYAFEDNNWGNLTAVKKAYYGTMYIDSLGVTPSYSERIKFEELKNEVGLKGYLPFKLFYAFSTEYSSFKRQSQYYTGVLIPQAVEDQLLFRLQSRYDLGKSMAIGAKWEFIPSTKEDSKKIYFQSKYLMAEYSESFFQQDLLKNYVYSNFAQWNTPLSNTQVRDINIRGNLLLGKNRFWFVPKASFQIMKDYVYYGTDRQPVKYSGGDINTVVFSAYMKLRLGNFYQTADITYTQTADVIRVPEWMGTYQIYYQRSFFEDAFVFQLGLDGRYFSRYKADYYYAPLQQYHIQDRFEIGGYPIIDAYLNFRVNRTRFFVKYTDLISTTDTEGVKGYFETPGYLGMSSNFEYGVNWKLFD